MNAVDKNLHDDRPLDQIPAVGFSLVHQLPVDQRSGETKNISFQGFFPVDSTDSEINTLLDKVIKASSRQRAKIRLDEAKYQLVIERRAAVRAQENLVSVDAERAVLSEVVHAQKTDSGRRNAHMSAQQIATLKKSDADREACVSNIRVAKDRIGTLEEEIEALERIIAAED